MNDNRDWLNLAAKLSKKAGPPQPILMPTNAGTWIVPDHQRLHEFVWNEAGEAHGACLDRDQPFWNPLGSRKLAGLEIVAQPGAPCFDVRCTRGGVM